jgi:integration host factor subunit beta
MRLINNNGEKMSLVKTWTKLDLTRRILKQTDEKQPVVEKIVSEIFTVLREELAEADSDIRIEIRGFGVLEVKPTKPKPAARNPKTGEIVYVPARRKTHFKPGRLLKEELSQPL